MELIVITGLTGSGKTAASIKLAKDIGGEIVSADSVQIYKDLDIGSAKIKEDEKEGIPHYMIDELGPNEECSIVTFRNLAREYLDDIKKRGKVPMLVGGTGFYIQGIVRDVEFLDIDKDENYRKELEEEARLYGNTFIHDKLKAVDMKSYEVLSPSNIKRVIRALEYYKLTGEKISDHNDRELVKPYYYDNKMYVLYYKDRSLLYRRIDDRVDEMVREGLVEEVKRLYDAGLNERNQSMQSIGYKEILKYLKGDSNLNDALDEVKKNTRHLAKRQMTWFKNREKDAKFLAIDEYYFNIDKIVEVMKGDIYEH